MNLHENYEKLTKEGIRIVDRWYLVLCKYASENNEIYLKGDDDAERFVDSLAILLLDSTHNKYLNPKYCKKCRLQLNDNEKNFHEYCK